MELAGDAILMPLSAGTTHRPPPLDERGFPITEARAGADYLMRRGVDPRRIVMEEWSYDTIGNAYFSLVAHVIPRGWRRVLAVTSAFHMARTEAIFRWVYSLDGGLREVRFESAPDAGVEPEALRMRLARERASLEAFQRVREGIATLAGLHEWLFAEHGAYRAGRRPAEAGVDITTY